MTDTRKPTARELVEALGGAWNEAKQQGMVLCVVHTERTPSLKIAQGDHAVMFYCFGCGANGRDVIPKLREVGLWPERGRDWDGPRPVRRAAAPKIEPRPININWASMVREWKRQTTEDQVERLAQSLGVTFDSLARLDAAWARNYGAWAFPMRDGRERIIGIRLRKPDGFKFAVNGSRSGLIIPSDVAEGAELWITEGPTDCAAGLALGFPTIGRPSCNSCEDMVFEFIRHKRIRRAVIVSDNDGPGKAGADKLQTGIPCPSLLWIPPTKDLREFVRQGGTAEIVRSLTRDLVWYYPKRRDQ